MSNHNFDVIDHQFEKGGTLIEASAGTGKTYSIAFLVLRMVVEQGLPIDSILVVTFTNAATAELQGRIRERLQEARDLLKDSIHNNDDKRLTEWVGLRRSLGADSIKQDLHRLNQALADVDQAQVSTIHSFCQRALSEFPLESRLCFTTELTKDIAPIKQQLIEDFWRKEIYPLAKQPAALIRQHFKAPTDLAKVLGKVHSPSNKILPQTDSDLSACLDTIEGLTSKLQGWIDSTLPAAKSYLEKGLVEGWFNKNQRGTLSTTLEHFTHDPLAFINKLQSASLKAHKPQAEEFINGLKAPVMDLQDLQVAQKALPFVLQTKLIQHYFAEIANLTQAFGVMSFNDLVTQLANLIKANNRQLIHCLKRKYQAALIDEFQDTDADQWCIFDALFNTKEHYLYLIGDPKQAIYKFRGADIYAYLQAKATCIRHLTLDTNWRSSPAMVTAVNSIYEHCDNPFKMGEAMEFERVNAGKTTDTYPQPFVCWQVPSTNQGNKWSAGALTDIIQANVCAEVTQLITAQQVEPKDIAILVSSNPSAASYQTALRKLGIATVINAKQSVFKTDEARDLLWLLQAIETPNSQQQLKQALCASVFGFNGNQLHDLFNHQDQQLEAWFEAFYVAHHMWLEKGFASALNSLMEHGNIIDTLCLDINAERRLTNWQHLLELTQNQINKYQLSLNQAVLWLANQLQQDAAEEGELRLETDADALQIVTMHSSKGLQYKIVFCPELYKGPKSANSVSFHDENNELVIDIGSDQQAAHKKLAAEESFAELLRLAYVALTRAEQKCYLIIGENNHIDASGYDKSAAHYLMANGLPEADVFEHKMMLHNPPVAPLAHSSAQASQYQALAFHKYINSQFTLTSFSGLTRNQHHDSRDLKDAETEADKHNDIVISNLPKGAHFGNLVHDLYEESKFSDLQHGPNSELLAGLMEKYGVQDLAPNLAEFNLMIKNSVATPLDESGFHLAQVKHQQCLKEMEFYYRLDQFDIGRFNQIMAQLGAEIPYNPLDVKQLSGYLNGSIDLFCEHNGKFYVMDYKTNSLPNYRPATMHAAMLEHNYGLQAVIYSLAAHQYLQQRLGDRYNYESHFGGAKYLFVRGMYGDSAEGGVYSFKPATELIDRLINELQGGQ